MKLKYYAGLFKNVSLKTVLCSPQGLLNCKKVDYIICVIVLMVYYISYNVC